MLVMGEASMPQFLRSKSCLAAVWVLSCVRALVLAAAACLSPSSAWARRSSSRILGAFESGVFVCCCCWRVLDLRVRLWVLCAELRCAAVAGVHFGAQVQGGYRLLTM
jgi:hypothetical protein